MSSMKRLLIIDANSLIHRAFHALPPLTTNKGHMVNALYGFLLVFFKVVKEFRPQYIAACFDAPGPTKREKKFIAYKAKRAKAPDELYDQIPLVKEALSAMGVPAFEKQGFEADDLLGTIAQLAPKRQAHPPLETIIVSGDMDALQLVNERTKVFTMRKGLQDTVLYDEAAVQKRFVGLRPAQLIDYKGLRGDPSDNIPGVTGIGEKTATALLTVFGSIANMYKEIEEQTPQARALKPKTKDLLTQYKDQAMLSRELGTIDTNVPIDFSLQGIVFAPSPAKVRKFLSRYEFKTLLSRVSDIVSENGKEIPAPAEPKEDSILSRIGRLYQDGVFSKKIFELEKNLVPVVRSMGEVGIAIDKEYFKTLGQKLAKQVAALEGRIGKNAGVKFNVSSPRQLSEVLFGTLGLSQKGLHKTPGGVVSTASPELEKIKDEHAIVADVLRFRELSKLLNTYVEPLPRMADAQNRVHAHFDQLGAATGRMSSSEPNLQNIPLQGEWGKEIRKGFVAKAEHSFVAFDYSQVELRIVAALAKEPKMQNVFARGSDIHTLTASEVFGVKPGSVTPALRYKAKALNFGIIYGMGARGFAESANVPFEEAQDFIDSYFAKFPRIAAFMEETKEFARKNGYVETLWGRKRYVPDIDSFTPQIRAAAERAAINHPVQGTAADFIKMAMVQITGELRLPSPSCTLLVQIHDELLFEMSDDIVKQLAPAIQKLMEQVALPAIQLVVQKKQGKNWGALTPFF